MAIRTGRPHICGGARKSRCVPKHGRNIKKCQRYLLYKMREHNRDRRMARIARSLERAQAKRMKRTPLATAALPLAEGQGC